MQIDHATAFLYALKPRGIRFGLENTRLVLDRLGRPQDSFQVIHIAGSNGKGSTASFLDAMLRKAGHRVGLYTSPHLTHYRERFQVNGQEVDDAAIEKAVDVLLAQGLEVPPEDVTRWVVEGKVTDKMQTATWYNQRGDANQFCRLTFFECTTILAALIFADLGVEVAVMECGMGGRLDATNVFTPVVSVITPIQLEHTEWLGSTLAAIAGEKAGIIKSGIPVVSAGQDPEAGAVIVDKARQESSPLSMRGDDFDGWGSWRQASFRVGQKQYGPVHLGLAGAHQVENAATALACLPALTTAGLEISDQAVGAALPRVSWPARFERFGPDGEWILDGAHNPGGAQALAELLREEFGSKPVHLVFGVLGEKEAEQMLQVLEALAHKVELVFPADARGRDPVTLKPFLKVPHAIHDSVTAAMDHLAEHRQSEVLVTGSLTVAGEAREWLLSKGVPHFFRPNS